MPSVGGKSNNFFDYLQRVFDPTKVAMDFSAEQAQKQRDFEAQMSNTAYERAVVDMQNAGLNPNMLYSGASGASTPVGSMATSSNSGGTSAVFGKVLSSALGMISNAMQISNANMRESMRMQSNFTRALMNFESADARTQAMNKATETRFDIAQLPRTRTYTDGYGVVRSLMHENRY